MLVVAAYSNRPAARGDEQFLYDVYKERSTQGMLNKEDPLDSVKLDRRSASITKPQAFFQALGVTKPNVTTEIDQRKAERAALKTTEGSS